MQTELGRCRPLILGTFLTFGACSGEPAVSHYSVRDSAGVQIVENSVAALESAGSWALASDPVLDLGAAEGAPELEFYRVVAGLIVDPSTIAVVNAGSQEIRFFDTSGSFLGAQGQEGDGPGEYRRPQFLFRTGGDSLLIWDAALGRGSLIDPGGSFLRTVNLQGDFVGPRVAGSFGDGTLLMVDRRFTPETATGDWQQLMALYTLHALSGEPTDTLGEFPFSRVKFMVATSTRAEAMLMGFDRETQEAVSGDRAWVGTTKEYELLRFTPDGTLSGILRWEGSDRTVTSEHLDLYLEERLARAPNDEIRAAIRTSHGSQEFAELFPAYSRILADDLGRVWVEEYRRPGAEGDNRWLVFDESGELEAVQSVPVSLRVLDIRGEQFLTVFTDELGVEYVRLFKLVRE